LAEGGQETKEIRCNRCGFGTNHVLRARYTWFRRIEDDSVLNLADLPDTVRPLATQGKLEEICKHENSIWSCAGCDTVTFEWQLMYAIPDDEGKWEEHDGDCVPTVLDLSMSPNQLNSVPCNKAGRMALVGDPVAEIPQ
jgi:hypothetical protein